MSNNIKTTQWPSNNNNKLKKQKQHPQAKEHNVDEEVLSMKLAIMAQHAVGPGKAPVGPRSESHN